MSTERVEQLREVVADDPTTFYVALTAEQALDVASGFVPHAVKAMVLTMIDWQAEDERRANRPVKTPKKSGKRVAPLFAQETV